MPKLYIKVDAENNPVGNPHFEENLKLLYPKHDFEAGTPSGWLEFVRVDPPQLGVYETFTDEGSDIALAHSHNGLTYELVDGKYQDVWHTRELTAEEKKAKQDQIKSDFAARFPERTSWTFDEAACDFIAPHPLPDDGENIYVWDEDAYQADNTQGWVIYTPSEE